MDDGRASWLERIIDRIPFLEKELLLLRRLVRAGDVCLDVGAAGGAHLLVMACRVGDAGRVIGVEPRPGSLRSLRWLVSLSGLADRVELCSVALADRAGEQRLRVPVVPTRAHLPGTSVGRIPAFAGLPSLEIDVPTTTLDALVAAEGLERLDVIKCDVEGAELLVLAGATEVLGRMRPIVILEADDLHQQRFEATAQDVIDAVRDHGYRVYRYRRGGLEPVPGVVPGEDDYVFVPDEREPPTLERVA